MASGGSFFPRWADGASSPSPLLACAVCEGDAVAVSSKAVEQKGGNGSEDSVCGRRWKLTQQSFSHLS